MISSLHYQSHQAHFDEIRRQAAGRPRRRRERTVSVRARLATLLAPSAKSTQPAFKAPALNEKPAISR